MWKIQIIKDTELPKVGTIVATWTGANGETFTYTGNRISRTVAGVTAFVNAARGALAAYQTETSAARADEVVLENLLNT